jgi:hypothetical protein
VGSKQATKVTATGFKATDVVRASAALLFPALIAQVNLRSKVGASELIYVEYFYSFSTRRFSRSPPTRSCSR